jgi:hypothetical protein
MEMSSSIHAYPALPRGKFPARKSIARKTIHAVETNIHIFTFFERNESSDG